MIFTGLNRIRNLIKGIKPYYKYTMFKIIFEIYVHLIFALQPFYFYNVRSFGFANKFLYLCTLTKST